MYQFTDVNGLADKGQGSDVTIGGVSLRQALTTSDGSCRLLTVGGRGLVGQVHQTLAIAGRHGSYYYGRSLGNRELSLKILLTGVSDLAFRRQYERLNKLVFTEKPTEIGFSDDPERFYFAQFNTSQEAEEVSNQAIVTLSFTCFDPFKYSLEKSVTGEVITYAGDMPTKPTVEVTLSGKGDEFRLLHVDSQRYIRLIGAFSPGQTIQVNMASGAITVDGRSALSQFDMVNSRYFGLLPGENTLSCNIESNISITYREVYL